ncbi:MAG: hypothetical protein JWR83_1031 [Aeromicrobium sp.]|nr:hypothetical protein [Aeromicrobium sp.]
MSWLRMVVIAGMVAVAGPVLLGEGSAAQAADPPSPSGTPTQTTTYGKVADKFSLTVSPTRLAVGPSHIGEVQKVLVVNRGESPLAVTVQKQDFTGGIDGSLKFTAHAPYSASDWVDVRPASFELAPGESRTVEATITVGANPDNGDHQVALVFLVPSVKAKGNIRINRGIGIPVYVTVPGPTDNSVSLTHLTAPGFVGGGGKVTVGATLRNTGTVHRDFRGASRLLLKASGASTYFGDFTIVRGSDRRISTQWDPPLICVCHVSVAIANADGKPQLRTVRVIVFPVRIAGFLLAALIAVLGGLRWRRRRYAAHVRAEAKRLVLAQGISD